MLDLLETAIIDRYNRANDSEPHPKKRMRMQEFSKPEQIKFVRFDGSMSQAQRSTAIQSFQSDPDIRILLVSLK